MPYGEELYLHHLYFTHSPYYNKLCKVLLNRYTVFDYDWRERSQEHNDRH